MPLNIIRQDITLVKCDAIVNPSNPELIGYSGIDLKIHELGGERLEKECDSLAPIKLNSAVISNAYNLNAKKIIHVAGPYYRDGLHNEDEDLYDSYMAVLNCAKENKIKHLAIPLISSGSYGYPKDKCLMIALNAISEYLNDNEMQIDLVVYDDDSYRISSKLFTNIRDYINQNEEDYMLKSMAPHRISLVECDSDEEYDLDDYLLNIEKSFKDTLIEFLDKSNESDPTIYKRANIDRKTFSKIMNVKTYHPSRNTVIALSIALRLNLSDTNKLLETCGYTLSKSSKFDLVVMYFIEHEDYDLFNLNEALLAFDLPLING